MKHLCFHVYMIGKIKVITCRSKTFKKGVIVTCSDPLRSTPTSLRPHSDPLLATPTHFMIHLFFLCQVDENFRSNDIFFINYSYKWTVSPRAGSVGLNIGIHRLRYGDYEYDPCLSC